MAFLLALFTATCGVFPLFLMGVFGSEDKKEKITGSIIAFFIAWPLLWWIYYAGTPSVVWPFAGIIGVVIVCLWLVCAILDCVIKDHFSWALVFPIIGALIFLGRGCGTSNVFYSRDYAKMIGTIEDREWTQDVQPKDPKHIRLVPVELAVWLANKQLGEAPGAIGSQFEVADEYMTLQMIKNELWYAAPLDYRGFGVWTSAKCAPGYVLVHAEDPLRQVIVKADEKFIYTPGAFFGENLERHLWSNGYYDKGMQDITFEIEEDGHAWWTMTIFEPTIGWWGKKVLGIAMVKPETGEIQFKNMDQIPHWVDRVIPDDFVTDYVTWWGELSAGWINSWWGSHNLTVPLKPNIIYGSDNEPYWMCDLTSSNEGDQSLVGLIYVNSRTGRAIKYHAVGNTETAAITAVNNKVSYRNLHGASPVIYNILGTMASIIPLLGANHTYQGVAIVKLDNGQVAIGDDQYVALREYQKLISMSGQQISPELAHAHKSISGKISRISHEVKGNETMYYILLENGDQLFTGASELSPKLPMAQPGDDAKLSFIETNESVVPMLGFDDISLRLKVSENQQAVNEKVEERKADAQKEKDIQSTKGNIQNLSESDLKEVEKILRERKAKAEKDVNKK